MFSKSSAFYDRIYAWKDYRTEAETVHGLIQRLNPWARSLLDVACGTGRHLEYLRSNYRAEGVDLDDELLKVAGARLPGVTLHRGDMRTFDLGREFDAVTCLFSSIGYARTEEGLNQTVANLTRHVGAKGILVIEPWFFPEQYEWGKVHASFVDDPDLKIARVNTSGPHGNVSMLEFHYVVGTPDGVESFTERHEVGLFTHEAYVDAFFRAGMEVHHDAEGLMGRGLYVGMKR
jgi:SAM-dependent methyltransferase